MHAWAHVCAHAPVIARTHMHTHTHSILHLPRTHPHLHMDSPENWNLHRKRALLFKKEGERETVLLVPWPFIMTVRAFINVLSIAQSEGSLLAVLPPC